MNGANPSATTRCEAAANGRAVTEVIAFAQISEWPENSAGRAHSFNAESARKRRGNRGFGSSGSRREQRRGDSTVADRNHASDRGSVGQ